MTLSHPRVLAALAAASTLVACNAGHGPHDGDVDSLPQAALMDEILDGRSVRGAFTIYADPYANGTPNPAAGIQGVVYWAELARGGTGVLLRISGAPALRHFGSHVHVAACDQNKAGGHYQNVVAPSPELVADPQYANPDNEVWLDLNTDENGRASTVAKVGWTFRRDGANAVILHDRHTDEFGKAGAKLACLDVNF